jgi:integrase
MGMGPLHTVSLAEARKRAAEHRLRRHDGIDPIEARRAERQQKRLDDAKTITFKECAEACINAHRAGWRNAHHATQWTTSIATYAYPVIGELSVQAIDTAIVLKVLEPIWTTKPETASRVRGRIEAVLNWASAREFRQGENPARWRGHLDKLLPARSKVRKVVHHAALPYDELAGFLVSLRKEGGIAARAFEFAILTAARTNEALGAQWSEINWLDKTWTVPADRMKAGKEHRVPLSAHALAILQGMQALRSAADGQDDAFIFPGAKRGRPLSDMAFLMLLKRMGRADVTVHGFRSSFRDWAAERTNFQSDVVEMALAHAVGSKVEAAYRRGDLFEKRRRLMVAWTTFCSAPVQEVQGNVAPLRKGSTALAVI